MKLEEEIVSANFQSNYHKCTVNILYTYGWLTDTLKRELNKHKVTLQQFNVLRILRGQYPNPATVNLLRERMLDKMSDASRIVDRLIQKELVTRCVSEKDRRAVDILISEKGLNMLKILDNEVKSADDLLKNNLNENEVIQLNELLDKLRG